MIQDDGSQSVLRTELWLELKRGYKGFERGSIESLVKELEDNNLVRVEGSGEYIRLKLNISLSAGARFTLRLIEDDGRPRFLLSELRMKLQERYEGIDEDSIIGLFKELEDNDIVLVEGSGETETVYLTL